MGEEFNSIYKRYFGGYEPIDAFLFHADEQLDGISLANKNILEVGCGGGAFSLYMALIGKAEKIIALDEAEGRGSNIQAFEQLQAITQNHSIPNLTVVKSSLNEYAAPAASFDLIIGNFSLHHAISPFGPLFIDKNSQQAALSTFKLFHSLLKNGGKIVLREMSRINFWRYLPYKWKMDHIDWKRHATLGEWLWAIRTVGFSDVHHAFLTPFFLRKWPSFLVRNICANFFFSSSFYLYGACHQHNKTL